MAGSGKVVLAPDKFKHSLAADQVATALSAGLRRGGEDVEVVLRPLADGGEGTVDVALQLGFSPMRAEVRGPLGATTEARYAIRGETAVLEASAACGLALLPTGPTRDTAVTATTHGVGELLLEAASRGARRLVLGVGGSASTDGGAGALQALGARLLGRTGEPVDALPLGLVDLAAVDLAPARELLDGRKIAIACDVDNPLLGPHGAASVYGRQKGAMPMELRRLEDGLRRWAEVVDGVIGHNLCEQPGTGASGGLAYGLAALGAELVSGVDFLLDLSGFDRVLADAALVVVGEGSLDAQSLRGKGPIGVARRAAAAGVPVVAVAGRMSLTKPEWHAAGLSAVYVLSDLEPDPARSISEADRLLEAVGARIAREWV